MSSLKGSYSSKEIKLFKSLLIWFDDNFDSISWTDRTQARTILNTAMKKVMADPGSIDPATKKLNAISYLLQLGQLLLDPPPSTEPWGYSESSQTKANNALFMLAALNNTSHQ